MSSLKNARLVTQTQEEERQESPPDAENRTMDENHDVLVSSGVDNNTAVKPKKKRKRRISVIPAALRPKKKKPKLLEDPPAEQESQRVKELSSQKDKKKKKSKSKKERRNSTGSSSLMSPSSPLLSYNRPKRQSSPTQQPRLSLGSILECLPQDPINSSKPRTTKAPSAKSKPRKQSLPKSRKSVDHNSHTQKPRPNASKRKASARKRTPKAESNAEEEEDVRSSPRQNQRPDRSPADYPFDPLQSPQLTTNTKAEKKKRRTKSHSPKPKEDSLLQQQTPTTQQTSESPRRPKTTSKTRATAAVNQQYQRQLLTSPVQRQEESVSSKNKVHEFATKKSNTDQINSATSIDHRKGESSNNHMHPDDEAVRNNSDKAQIKARHDDSGQHYSGAEKKTTSATNNATESGTLTQQDFSTTHECQLQQKTGNGDQNSTDDETQQDTKIQARATNRRRNSDDMMVLWLRNRQLERGGTCDKEPGPIAIANTPVKTVMKVVLPTPDERGLRINGTTRRGVTAKKNKKEMAVSKSSKGSDNNKIAANSDIPKKASKRKTKRKDSRAPKQRGKSTNSGELDEPAPSAHDDDDKLGSVENGDATTEKTSTRRTSPRRRTNADFESTTSGEADVQVPRPHEDNKSDKVATLDKPKSARRTSPRRNKSSHRSKQTIGEADFPVAAAHDDNLPSIENAGVTLDKSSTRQTSPGGKPLDDSKRPSPDPEVATRIQDEKRKRCIESGMSQGRAFFDQNQGVLTRSARKRKREERIRLQQSAEGPTLPRIKAKGKSPLSKGSQTRPAPMEEPIVDDKEAVDDEQSLLTVENAPEMVDEASLETNEGTETKGLGEERQPIADDGHVDDKQCAEAFPTVEDAPETAGATSVEQSKSDDRHEAGPFSITHEASETADATSLTAKESIDAKKHVFDGRQHMSDDGHVDDEQCTDEFPTFDDAPEFPTLEDAAAVVDAFLSVDDAPEVADAKTAEPMLDDGHVDGEQGAETFPHVDNGPKAASLHASEANETDEPVAREAKGKGNISDQDGTTKSFTQEKESPERQSHAEDPPAEANAPTEDKNQSKPRADSSSNENPEGAIDESSSNCNCTAGKATRFSANSKKAARKRKVPKRRLRTFSIPKKPMCGSTSDDDTSDYEDEDEDDEDDLEIDPDIETGINAHSGDKSKKRPGKTTTIEVGTPYEKRMQFSDVKSVLFRGTADSKTATDTTPRGSPQTKQKPHKKAGSRKTRKDKGVKRGPRKPKCEDATNDDAQKSSTKGRLGYFTSIRCGDCIGCRALQNCGKCKPCLDKPEFGGPGKTGKLCVLKRCIKPVGGKRISYAAAKAAAAQEASVPSSGMLQPLRKTPKDDLDNESMSLCESTTEELSDMEYDEEKTRDIIAVLQSSRSPAAKPAEISTSHSDDEAAADAHAGPFDILGGLGFGTTKTVSSEVGPADVARKMEEQQRSEMLDWKGEADRASDSDSDGEDDAFLPPPPAAEYFY
ncbi:FYRC [Seminavis robusta]|uniref:FYRC n=1 Tax=Seminavis robusta TaxID=568900 RepID=A0A9N8ESJ6_9STRA|nr:FYRC [Seminavis robusta]|eukprot:Sro1654_g288900.1 FYRC (1481) ;mRNA; r:9883-14325